MSFTSFWKLVDMQHSLINIEYSEYCLFAQIRRTDQDATIVVLRITPTAKELRETSAENHCRGKIVDRGYVCSYHQD